ncbi:hypothetical protein AWC00_16915 [Mycobacterium conspicuum]|nr:hypothetical protein AWC00_16915 [Mycobacterium conspicuum]
MATIALVVGVAALVVALARSTHAGTPAATITPAYTPAENTAAQRQLCDTYTLAARAVQVETNGTDKALARISLTNAAAMLDNAAANPALDAPHRDATHVLANAYRTTTALSSAGTDDQWRASLDDIIAKDAVMKRLCGGG